MDPGAPSKYPKVDLEISLCCGIIDSIKSERFRERFTAHRGDPRDDARAKEDESSMRAGDPSPSPELISLYERISSQCDVIKSILEYDSSLFKNRQPPDRDSDLKSYYNVARDLSRTRNQLTKLHNNLRYHISASASGQWGKTLIWMYQWWTIGRTGQDALEECYDNLRREWHYSWRVLTYLIHEFSDSERTSAHGPHCARY